MKVKGKMCFRRVLANLTTPKCNVYGVMTVELLELHVIDTFSTATMIAITATELHPYRVQIVL